jgi:hypothetical protein
VEFSCAFEAASAAPAVSFQDFDAYGAFHAPNLPVVDPAVLFDL